MGGEPEDARGAGPPRAVSLRLRLHLGLDTPPSLGVSGGYKAAHTDSRLGPGFATQGASDSSGLADSVLVVSKTHQR